MKLSHLSDAELLSGIQSLRGSERSFTARVVAHLAEIESRKLHLATAHSSLFDYCLRSLNMSEGEAFRRITAARLLRRFPVIFELIDSGSLHLTGLALLKDALTDENHRELLQAACGKTKREIQLLLAGRFPKEDAPSLIRKLPEPKPAASASPGVVVATTVGPVESTIDRPGPQPASALEPAPNEPRAAMAPRVSPSHDRPRVEPLSAARYKVQFTASAEHREKLERICDLMSHSNPSRDLGVVFERAVDLLLRDLEKKKLKKTDRPKSARAPTDSDHIPNKVRREVCERDGGQCTFEDEHGHRCPARALLQLDHIFPRALGGKAIVENLRLRCQSHNLLEAERVFGREHVQRSIHLRQQQRVGKSDAPTSADDESRGFPLSECIESSFSFAHRCE